jgi:hypothetical protein
MDLQEENRPAWSKEVQAKVQERHNCLIRVAPHMKPYAQLAPNYAQHILGACGIGIPDKSVARGPLAALFLPAAFVLGIHMPKAMRGELLIYHGVPHPYLEGEENDNILCTMRALNAMGIFTGYHFKPFAHTKVEDIPETATLVVDGRSREIRFKQKVRWYFQKAYELAQQGFDPFQIARRIRIPKKMVKPSI